MINHFTKTKHHIIIHNRKPPHQYGDGPDDIGRYRHTTQTHYG